MAIVNGLGFAGYSRMMPRGFEGQPAETEGCLSRAYRNPRRAQVTNIAIGGVGADTDAITVRITKPDGTVVSTTVTRTGGVPVDDAAMALALATALNAQTALRGHVVASASTTNLVLTFSHTNIVYPVSTTLVGTTATITTTTAAGGAVIPFGRFVSAGSSIDGQPELRELQNADAETVVTGVTLRRLDVENAGDVLASAVDGVPIGDMTPVAFQGAVLMRNNGGVASAVNGAVYVVVNDAGGQSRGMARADDDAANSIPLDVRRAYWAEVVQPGELGAVWLDM